MRSLERHGRELSFRRCARASSIVGIGCAMALAGCAKPSDVTEPGALLVRLLVASGAALPDEVRVWAYDDAGVLFASARIPSQGTLKPTQPGGPELGTVLIQPGMSSGLLRLHARGLRVGERIADGVARVPAEARARGRFDLTLTPAVPDDADNDDVPDSIDHCPAVSDPEQRGCVDGGAGEPGSGADAGAASTGGAGGGATGTGGSGGAAGADAAAGAGGTSGGGAGTPGSGGAPGTGGSASATGGRAASGGSGGGVATGGSGGGAVDGGVTDTRPPDAQAMEVAKKVLGAACGTASECASAFCADGFCCQSACNQPCQACNNQGRCNDVMRADDVPECSGNRTCNNRGTCVIN